MSIRASSAPERYLWRRANSPYLWFRMAVPKQHQERVGKATIAFSLKTSDRRQASLMAARERARLQDEWAAYETRTNDRVAGLRTPTDREMRNAAKAKAFEKLTTELRDSLMNRTEADRSKLIVGIQTKYEQFREERNNRSYEQVRIIARKGAASNGWRVPRGSPIEQRLCHFYAEALCDGLNVILRERVHGELNPLPQTETVLSASQQGPVTAKAGETIEDFYERYAERKLHEGRQSEDTVAQNRKVVQAFARFVGPKRAVASIERVEAREFRDTLATLPPNFSKRKEFARMSLREVADEARRMGLEPTKPANLNRQLAAVTGLFRWLCNDGYIESNPFEGLNYSVQKQDNRRPPFDTDQLNEVLQSPLFTGFKADGKEFEVGEQRADDWRYWIPLVCLFTGARIGEVAQLHVSDVRVEHGVTMIHFRHDPDNGQRTKSRKSRAIPVHRILRDIGFEAFVEEQRNRKQRENSRRLFPEIEMDARGSLGGRPSRFWRWYLSRIGVKQAADGLGSHSFRHGVADELRLAEYTDDQLGPLVLGHSNKTVTQGYGKLPQGTVAMLDRMIQAIRFEGVDFGHLRPDAASGRSENQAKKEIEALT